MNKFRRYKCDTCNKEVDVDNNLTHAFIDRCNLTVGCLGTLRLIGEKNFKDNIINFESQVQTNLIGGASSDLTLPEYVNLASSITNEIALAVRSDVTQISNNSELILSLSEIMNKEQEYKEYVFNLSVPISVISGKDHSVGQKVLTFESTDTIVMFINGQEVDASLFVAESNLIRFTNQVTYNTYSSSAIFVKVLVFAKQQAVTKNLTFKRNVQGLSSSAWANVDAIQLDGQLFEVFTCQALTDLVFNSRLMVSSAKIGTVDIPLENITFLLSKEPFQSIDRINTRVVRASVLDSSVRHLKYILMSKEPKVLVSSLAISDVFPPIYPDTVFNQKSENSVTQIVADDTSLNLEITSNNKFILGPI